LTSETEIDYRASPTVSNQQLNSLFSAGAPGQGWRVGQTSPDTSDWTAVLEHSLVYVCAYAGECLVGFVNVAWDGRDHAFLLDPRVHPDFRHRGVGTELVRLAADAARDAGCEWLHVDFSPDLWPFYTACGFTPTDAGVVRLKD
jgi:GNAT superfamily N-acetyltransferase